MAVLDDLMNLKDIPPPPIYGKIRNQKDIMSRVVQK